MTTFRRALALGATTAAAAFSLGMLTAPAQAAETTATTPVQAMTSSSAAAPMDCQRNFGPVPTWYKVGEGYSPPFQKGYWHCSHSGWVWTDSYA
ncbi:hypothetical protein [Streptomyces boluensis]|uniref:Secreted protein n=1 Tax=Streptomyces boluensis TaxID=1775135 RepID=A0A964UT48_9ACTN|nr:hypothetical protein [Streptomyces boluensis]NBE54948.1 hypothetical protein [Streptomyces boluensis]